MATYIKPIEFFTKDLSPMDIGFLLNEFSAEEQEGIFKAKLVEATAAFNVLAISVIADITAAIKSCPYFDVKIELHAVLAVVNDVAKKMKAPTFEMLDNCSIQFETAVTEFHRILEKHGRLA